MSDKADRINGSRPKHTHQCATAEPIHTWECNSPYCEDMVRVCVPHGGREPIIQGEEPWKGR